MTIIYNSDLKIIDVINNQPCLFFQYQLEKLINCNLNTLSLSNSDPNQNQFNLHITQLTKAKKEKKNIFFKYHSQNHEKITFAVSHIEFCGEEEILQHICQVDQKDITQEEIINGQLIRELNNKDSFLNKILNQIPIPIYIKDIENNNKYLFGNKESSLQFKEQINTSSENIAYSENSDKIRKLDKQVFETEETYFGQEKIITPNGKEYETIVHKSTIWDGNKKYLLIVRWDESAQQELQRKSKMLSVSMNALNAFSWYFDSKEEQLIFGDGFENTGGNRKTMNNMAKFANQIHPDDREYFLDLMGRFIKQDSGVFAVEYRIDLANVGKYEWWECRGAMEPIEKEGVCYKDVYGIDININKLKKNEAMLIENENEMEKLIKQNELILHNTNSVIVFISTDYTVQWENVSNCSIGIPKNAYKKGTKCYKSAYNKTSPCSECIMTKAIQSRQIEKKETELNNKEIIEITAIPIFNNNDLEGTVLRIDNITKRRQMISALQQAKLQAEESDKLKSAFLANMSHEIRTPLNAIVGFSELLMSTTEPSEKEEFTKIIQTNTELLLKLISDILDLSKIEAGLVNLTPEQFDLAEYFENIASSMRCRIDNPNINFICKSPYQKCMVTLDKNRFAQIITNFITNSIKYTVQGYIEMGYDFLNGQLFVYVKDSGIGIAKEKRHKVFQRFEKLDEFAQGTGLGLSICKAIAEAFGGTIGFESKENEGSCFWVYIPCQAVVQNSR